MTHILRKDLLFLLKPPVWFILLLNAFLWDGYSERLQSIAFAGPILALQFVFLLAVYDGWHRNDIFIQSLPIRRRTVVHSKYGEGIVLTLIGYALAFVLELPVYIARGFALWTISYPMFVRGLLFALISVAVFYYVHFRTRTGDVEKSVGGAAVAAIAASAAMIYVLRQIPDDLLGGLAWSLLLAGGALVYAWSHALSLRNYERKDL